MGSSAVSPGVSAVGVNVSGSWADDGDGFFLLKPRLLAKFANVRLAVNDGLAASTPLLGICELVASGEVLGRLCDVVLLRLLRAFAIPSEIDPSGDGVSGKPKGFPSPADDGEEASIG